MINLSEIEEIPSNNNLLFFIKLYLEDPNFLLSALNSMKSCLTSIFDNSNLKK